MAGLTWKTLSSWLSSWWSYSAGPSTVLWLTPENRLSVFTSWLGLNLKLPCPKPPSPALEAQVLLGLNFIPSFPRYTWSLIRTHMHILYFAMNMMKGRERKVKDPREQTDPVFYLKSLCFFGSWDSGFGVSAQFERSSCLLLVEKGGKKAASLSLCLNLQFTWKSVRLTHTSLTCQRAAAGRGVFDL